MAQFKLSICIPTFNREPFLKEALDSIIAQLTDENRSKIQIVVSDNASQDNTEALVNEYRKEFANIEYYRWPENMGFDRNLLKVVDLAAGDYCWLFGSDDKVPDGKLSIVLKEVFRGTADLILFERYLSDRYFTREPELDTFVEGPGNIDINTCTGFEQFEQYLERCKSLGALFSFISSIVVRKQQWSAVENTECFVGTDYIHVYMTLKIIAQGAHFSYCKTPVVVARLGNDSLLEDNTVEAFYRRLRVDIDGYSKIVRSVFESDSRICFKVLSKVEDIIPKGYLHTIYAGQKKENGKRLTKIEFLLLNNGFYRKYKAMKRKYLLKKLSFRF